MPAPIIPPLQKQLSEKGFFVPPALESDFTNFLYTDVPHLNYTFELVGDWYDRDKPDYSPKYIRATAFSINWKSKMNNADNADNFKTNYEHICKKGDYVVEQGNPENVLIFNWRVARNPNNQATQAQICNLNLVVERDVPEVIDSDAMLVTAATKETIVPAIPALAYIYEGRPDYVITNNTPGVIPDHIVVLQVQYNDKTKMVKTGDEFEWGDYRYRIVNKDPSQVQRNGESGILTFQAKKIAGSAQYEEV